MIQVRKWNKMKEMRNVGKEPKTRGGEVELGKEKDKKTIRIVIMMR
jgi:hypothetical protein